MKTVAEVIATNKVSGKRTLIAYFPAGFPNFDESLEACIAMCENGVDVLELGIPYSDPVMDGPVIQEATELALGNGFKLARTFELVSKIATSVDVPILVMTYWNPVVQYGVRRFAEELKNAGEQV